MTRFPRTLRQWFLARTTPKETWRLFLEIGRDEPARRSFDRLCRLERALCRLPDDAPPWTHFDSERMEREILERLRTEEGLERRPARALSWGWIAAAAAGLALLLAMVWNPFRAPPPAPPSRNETLLALLTPRGAEEPADRPHLYALCVVGEGPDASAHRLDRRPYLDPEPGRCPLKGEIQFGLSNPPPGKKYLAILGLDGNGRRLWYYPRPSGEGSLKIEPGETPSLFMESLKLSVNHRPGLIRIYAVFSDEPLSRETLDRAAKGAGHPAFPEQLPLEGIGIFQESATILLSD